MYIRFAYFGPSNRVNAAANMVYRGGNLEGVCLYEVIVMETEIVRCRYGM